MKKSLLLTALATLSWQAAHADDYGLWLDMAAQKNFSKKLSASIEADLRGENQLRDLTRASIGLGMDYKPIKWFSLGVGYSFIADYNLSETKVWIGKNSGKFKGYKVDDAYWRNKHRATVDVTGSLPLGRFTLSLRERYQYTHFVATTTDRTEYSGEITNPDGFTGEKYAFNDKYFSSMERTDDSKGAKDRHYLRSRIGVEYNIHHCNWTPYATYEFSNDLSNGLHLDKQRLTVGTELKVNKQHRFDFAYVYTHGMDDDNGNDNLHVLSIGYKFKF